MPGKIADPNVDIWYTVRSGISSCFGAGVCGPRGNHRENIPMGSPSSVFQTAVMAVLRCAELLLSKNVNEKENTYLLSSRAAIAALAKTTT